MNIHVNDENTEFIARGPKFVFECQHINTEEEDGNDGRVYCLDCGAKGFINEEEEYEGLDFRGEPEYSVHKWVDWR